MKLSEEAKQYEPVEIKNISELDKIPVDVDVRDETFNRDDGTSFDVKLITVNEQDYKVPLTVLKQLKAILEEKADLKTFKVAKKGEGLKTTYTTIPL